MPSSVYDSPLDLPPGLLSPDGILPVQAVPKSPKNQIDGVIEAANGKRWLKIRINAPPEDGKANEELLRFLAKHWKLKKSQLEIISGHTARFKLIRLTD